MEMVVWIFYLCFVCLCLYVYRYCYVHARIFFFVYSGFLAFLFLLPLSSPHLMPYICLSLLLGVKKTEKPCFLPQCRKKVKLPTKKVREKNDKFSQICIRKRIHA